MRNVLLSILVVVLVLVVVIVCVLLYLNWAQNNFYSLIKNRFEYGMYEDVIRDGTKFLATYPKSKYYNEVEYFVTFSAYKLGNIETSQDRLMALIRKFFSEGKNDEVLTRSIELLGDILREKGQAMNPEIEEYLKRTLTIVKDETTRNNILTQLGYIYYYRKDYNTALIYFDRANTELSEIGKARVFVETGDYEKAFYIYDNFLQYRKGSKYYNSVVQAYSKQLYHYAFKAMKEKDYSIAARYFAKVVNTFPNTPYEDAGLYWLGEIYTIYKKYDRAIEFFDKAMNNEPKNKDEDALFKKGVVLYQAGKIIDAIANFKKFLLEYPNSRLSGEAKKWVDVLTKELQYVEEDTE